MHQPRESNADCNFSANPSEKPSLTVLPKAAPHTQPVPLSGPPLQAKHCFRYGGSSVRPGGRPPSQSLRAGKWGGAHRQHGREMRGEPCRRNGTVTDVSLKVTCGQRPQAGEGRQRLSEERAGQAEERKQQLQRPARPSNSSSQLGPPRGEVVPSIIVPAQWPHSWTQVTLQQQGPWAGRHGQAGPQGRKEGVE